MNVKPNDTWLLYSTVQYSAVQYNTDGLQSKFEICVVERKSF